jgi:hypothetical protein
VKWGTGREIGSENPPQADSQIQKKFNSFLNEFFVARHINR